MRGLKPQFCIAGRVDACRAARICYGEDCRREAGHRRCMGGNTLREYCGHRFGLVAFLDLAHPRDILFNSAWCYRLAEASAYGLRRRSSLAYRETLADCGVIDEPVQATHATCSFRRRRSSYGLSDAWVRTIFISGYARIAWSSWLWADARSLLTEHSLTPPKSAPKRFAMDAYDQPLGTSIPWTDEKVRVPGFCGRH